MESVYIILFVCYASYAHNRKSVSFVIPKLIEEGLDTSHAGLILSCQNTAFALSKFLAGLLSDRTNPRLLFASGLLVSGLTTVLFSSSSSLTAFCGLWFLNGVAQGCGWPSCAKILRQKASPSRFGTLWSILSSSNNVSGSLAPFLSAYIIYGYGWRASVFVAGVTSMLLGLMCFFGLASASNNDTKPKKGKESSKEKGIVSGSESVLDLLTDPFLWLVSMGFFVAVCTKTAFGDWGKLYLTDERNRSQMDGSVFTSSLESGGFLGRIAAGYLTDYFVRRQLLTSDTNHLNGKTSIRMYVAVFFLLGGLLLTHALRTTVTAASSTVWLTILGFFLGSSVFGLIAIYGIVASESAPSHLSGSSHAIASLAGNVGAMISGLPFCYVAKHHSWATVFLLLQLAMGVLLCLTLCCRNLQPTFLKLKKDV